MKKLLQFALKILAKKILKKYKPGIIGITGSVGKTSAKEAIYTVLKERFKVRRNMKNYNNEIGVPLTIIGEESAGKSFLGWFKVILQGFNLIFISDKNYPKILILEMAADRPGDIKYLVNLAPCQVGVITAIGPTHLEFFHAIEKILEEKQILITHLSKDSFTVLNRDDDLVYPLEKKTKAKVLTFGFSPYAHLKALDMAYSLEQKSEALNSEILGKTSFKLSYKGSQVPVFLPNVLGKIPVYASLAGASVGIVYGLNLIEISKKLKYYKPPKGRMNLIKGIKETIILDDTYNSSPEAAKKALEILSKLDTQGRKYAILGDMLELGGFTEQGHREVGEKVKELEIDVLITVGERARDISRGARKAGMAKDMVFEFGGNEEAGRFIQNRIEKDDLILVKGSQGMRMEKIVKEIMREPMRAKELLVRQEEKWLRR